MTEAHTKQLEERLARYEGIMNQCPRCKAALASEEVECEKSPEVPPSSASSSQQNAGKDSSTASALLPKRPMPNTRQNQSTRSSKQNTSASQSSPLSSTTDAANPVSSISAPASRLRKTATGPSQDTNAHSLHIRPRALKPSASGTFNVSADSNRLNKTGPRLSRSDSNPRVDPHKQAAWGVSADKMLGEIPLGWVWLARVKELDKSMLAAVAIDTAADSANTVDAVDDTQDKDHLLRLVRDFAHRHSEKRADFQQFLLVCLCRVLAAQMVSQSSIVETLQICISDSMERNIDRYLKGAKWVNELMDRLFLAGWRYRAVDLLLLCVY